MDAAPTVAPGRRRQVRRWPSLALAGAALAVAVAIAAAGVASGWGSPPPLQQLDLGAAGVEQADGLWVVVELAPRGRPLPRAEPVPVHLDTTTAALEAVTGCNVLLGSFTLEPSGLASFTVPSARRATCPPALEAHELAVRDTLGQVTRWERTGEQLLLTGPDGYLVLAPA